MHKKTLMRTIRTLRVSFLLALFLSGGALSVLAVPGAQAAGASLYLSPASGSYAVGATFTVSVKVNTGGQAVNAAQGSLSFDSSVLQAVSVSRGGSVFSLWTAEPTISGASVNFGGGVPHPGYNGSAGQVFSITFKTKKEGTAAVRLSGGAILASDGKGTDILTGLGSGSYQVSAAAVKPKPEAKPTTDAKKPEPSVVRLLPQIKSATHPDQNAWSNLKGAEFSWELPAGVNGVSVSFNKESVDDPGPVSDGVFSEKSYEADEDGLWYLHLKFKDSQGWGAVEHYRVMIDTKPPLPFEVEFNKGEDSEWPFLQFEAKDEDSGLGKYEVFIGSLEHQAHELAADSKQLSVEGLSAGKHTALVKAVDKAGNERLETIEFYIDPIPTPVIEDYPKEVALSDKLYISGRAEPQSTVNVYIERNNAIVATSSVASDANGRWLFLANNLLPKGRYTAWVDAVNGRGIKSEPSARISFLVTPPVFTVIGTFVINYFTVLTSLIFLVVLIVFLVVFVHSTLKRRVRKESHEVEDIIRHRLDVYKTGIDVEFDRLKELESKPATHKKEKEEVRRRLKEKIEAIKSDSLKEIDDVEKLVK